LGLTLAGSKGQQEAQLMLTTGSTRLVKVNKHGTMLDMVSYCAIVTFFKISRFTIFDFKTVVTLKAGLEVTQGH